MQYILSMPWRRVVNANQNKAFIIKGDEKDAVKNDIDGLKSDLYFGDNNSMGKANLQIPAHLCLVNNIEDSGEGDDDKEALKSGQSTFYIGKHYKNFSNMVFFAPLEEIKSFKDNTKVSNNFGHFINQEKLSFENKDLELERKRLNIKSVNKVQIANDEVIEKKNTGNYVYKT